MKDFLKKNGIQLVTFFIICVSLFIKISSDKKPYATGDGVEYSLITEALFNHLSPNVEARDCESFKNAFIKVNKWEENDKAVAYEETQKFISSTNHKLLDCSSKLHKPAKRIKMAPKRNFSLFIFVQSFLWINNFTT